MGEYERQVFDIDDIVHPVAKFSYDASDNIEYAGLNKNASAGESDETWKITKLAYDGSDNITTSKIGY